MCDFFNLLALTNILLDSTALRRNSDKTYILNGGRRHRGWPEFTAGGALFKYSKKNDHLRSKGPLRRDLDFLVRKLKS